MLLTDRTQAGQLLAEKLKDYADRHGVIVLGLPRGGIPVAREIAHALHAPLDIFIVRKLGVPGHEEVAMGAVAGAGVRTLDADTVEAFGVPASLIERTTAQQTHEVERQQSLYRQGKPDLDLSGKTVILVDDGMATGATMATAIAAVRRQNPCWVVVAVPVCPPITAMKFETLADDFICLATPYPFHAVSQFYKSFDQLTDEQVQNLLQSPA